MLRILRFDFFKIRKSLTLRVIFIFSLICCFLNPLIKLIQGAGGGASLSNFQGMSSVQYELIIPIFVIFFVGMDFSSKNIKNFYARTNKLLYVLSKVIFIFLYVVALIILDLAFEFFVNVVFLNGSIYSDSLTLSAGELLLNYFLKWGIYLCVGLLSMALILLIKNRAIAVVIVFVYYFFASAYLYTLINQIIGTHFDIKPYTIFGNLGVVATMYLYKNPLLYGLDILCYSLVSYAIGVLAYLKKGV